MTPADPDRTRPVAPRAGPSRGDVLVAVLAGLTLGPLSVASLGGGWAPGLWSSGVGALVVIVVAGICAALAWRRSSPETSAVAVYLGALAHVVLLGVPVLPVDVLVLVALYSVTAHGSVVGHRVALGGALLGAVVLAAALGAPGYWSGPDMFAVVLATGGAAAGAWGVGLLRRTAIQDRARSAQIERLAEIDRERGARLAVTDERTRIARELHDVVAHTLSVVIAQADGGRYAAAQDPQAAERALATIGEVGRGALGDIRRILGVLRGDDAGAALVPQPVDEDLDRLVEQVRGSGLGVSVVRLGESRPLPAGAGLMVYRIAQEALTNALKHAGPAAAVTVLVKWSPAGLTLQIDDDGRGAAARGDGQGQGLVGMRERTAVLGGTLLAGPAPAGGYRVRLEVPVHAGAGPHVGQDRRRATERTPT
ncbi:sensor histidine kinase [Georgenia sp. Z1491]|uniref:sensor histidine kinase n=1 Tax=Georgenia sp. Z1491 TaxID=3416707 RepID=UPI003CF8CF7E